MTASVTGFKVWHAGAAGDNPDRNTRTFRIESAVEASGPWQTEFIVDNTSQNDTTEVSYPGVQIMRHVRLYITDPGNDGIARICEFEVIAEPPMIEDLPVGPNLALSAASVQTSSVYGPEWTGTKAIDGVISGQSKWTSADVNPPHTLTLDLGSYAPVAGFILRQPSAAGEEAHFNALSFSLQTARTMGGPWFTEARVLNPGDSDFESRTFTAPKDLRYVRLVIDDPGIDRIARVPEFEVIQFQGILASFQANPTYGLAPLAVTFTDQSLGDITNWLWSFGDGDGSELQNPIHTYDEPGTYTVALTVNGPAGSDTRTLVDYITVDPVAADLDVDGDVDLDERGYCVRYPCLVACWDG